MTRLVGLVMIAACGNADAPALPDGSSVDGRTIVPDGPEVRAPLEVTSLGVQGFALRYADELVLTAPMFTRQSTFAVTLGLPLAADAAAIDDGMSIVATSHLRAIVSGHAHYDHLLDVPPILASAPGAHLYTNLSGRHMLAALAPDRPGCTNAQPTPVIARDRVIAMDDPLASHVDYTNCPGQRPAGAPLEGSWIDVPGSHIRVMAFCAMHPDQIGPVHFGAGSVDTDQCEVPGAASGWLEGATLAFLIDFFDEHGQRAYRVFYQDAPGDPPIGEVPPALLAEAPVDLALLCVGTYAAVENHPTAVIDNLDPRFVVSGHWEDFFVPRSQPAQPQPLLDLPTYVQRAEAAVAGPSDGVLTVDGTTHPGRHVLAQPEMTVIVPARR